jgi:hypothetical protein
VGGGRVFIIRKVYIPMLILLVVDRIIPRENAVGIRACTKSAWLYELYTNIKVHIHTLVHPSYTISRQHLGFCKSATFLFYPIF